MARAYKQTESGKASRKEKWKKIMADRQVKKESETQEVKAAETK